MTNKIQIHPKAGNMVHTEQIKIGKNGFPNVQPSLSVPFPLPQYPISAKLAAGR